jgi:ferrochelatase
VLWGNRNWEPFISDAVAAAHEYGFSKLLAIGTSAYSSYSSCRQYREDYALALETTELGGDIQIDKVRQFFDHPGFVQPFIEGTAQGLRDAATAGFTPAETQVLFSTHSIPSTDAARSGPAERGFGAGGAYEAQHLAVGEVVMAAVGPSTSSGTEASSGSEESSGTAIGWSLVYQSRSGPPAQAWLEPDINDAMRELAASGIRAFVIVPLGFVSDHMEVKWDLDTEAMETAKELGVFATRVPTPGIHPAYVSGLVDLVLERVNGTPTEDRPALTELGPWYDVCRAGCCENVRLGFKPALAGIAP